MLESRNIEFVECWINGVMKNENRTECLRNGTG